MRQLHCVHHQHHQHYQNWDFNGSGKDDGIFFCENLIELHYNKNCGDEIKIESFILNGHQSVCLYRIILF